MSANPILRPLAGVALRAQPDSELVDLFRQGHERAYEEIVRRYRSALVAFAGAIVPTHRAEDVVQESLLRAHGALAADNEIDVRPWLYTIVRNRALNSIRDERQHDDLPENLDGVPQPPDVLARREELSGLVAGLKALPDAQRTALVRREMEGLSHAEIAGELGATPGAVRGLIFRARAALRNVSGFLVPPSLAQAALGVSGGGAAAGAAGVAAGGGSGLLVKAGVAATVGALAVGGGLVVHDQSASSRARDSRVTPSRSGNGGDGGSAIQAEPVADTGGGSDEGGATRGAGSPHEGSSGNGGGSEGPAFGAASSGTGGDGTSSGSGEQQGPTGRNDGPDGSGSSGSGEGSDSPTREGSDGGPGPDRGRDGGGDRGGATEPGDEGLGGGDGSSSGAPAPSTGSTSSGDGGDGGHGGSGDGGSDGGSSGSGDSGGGSGTSGGSGDGDPLDELPIPGSP